MCVRFLIVNLGVALLAACGGAGAEGGVTGGEAGSSGAPVVPVAQATETSSAGTAGQGAACDYGGADATTCTAGLECCYGEHARPDGYGSCQPECNWDD